MKLLRKLVRNLLIEVSDFSFSVNPIEYFDKEMGVEELHQIVSLILDSDGINYVVDKSRAGYNYEFGYVDEDTYEYDTESYQAFHALIAALKQAGIPHARSKNAGRNGEIVYSFQDYPGGSGPNDMSASVGILFLKQKAKRM